MLLVLSTGAPRYYYYCACLNTNNNGFAAVSRAANGPGFELLGKLLLFMAVIDLGVNAIFVVVLRVEGVEYGYDHPGNGCHEADESVKSLDPFPHNVLLNVVVEFRPSPAAAGVALCFRA